jgi:hypothetical protein
VVDPKPRALKLRHCETILAIFLFDKSQLTGCEE